jgi:hypothetical protein
VVPEPPAAPRLQRPWWHPFAAGVVAGTADTLCNFPPYGLHYRLQLGQDIAPWRNPRVWMPPELYRGVLAYAAIIPITGICDGVTSWLESRHGIDSALAAPVAGVVAAVCVSAPTTNVIVNQQRLSDPILRQLAASEITKVRASHELRVAKPGPVLRGLLRQGVGRLYWGVAPIAAREAVYSSAVFSASARAQAAYPNLPWYVTDAAVGTAATLISQPLDILATQTMASTAAVRPTVLAVARERYKVHGVRKGFWRGFAFRNAAIIAGIVVMRTASDATKDALK